MYYYSGLGVASDWLKKVSLVAWLIRSTTQIWVVTCFKSMEFLCLFFRHHFARIRVAASQNFDCFLRLFNIGESLVSSFFIRVSDVIRESLSFTFTETANIRFK